MILVASRLYNQPYIVVIFNLFTVYIHVLVKLSFLPVYTSGANLALSFHWHLYNVMKLKLRIRSARLTNFDLHLTI